MAIPFELEIYIQKKIYSSYVISASKSDYDKCWQCKDLELNEKEEY
jgi:hypothetical protein